MDLCCQMHHNNRNPFLMFLINMQLHVLGALFVNFIADFFMNYSYF